MNHVSPANALRDGSHYNRHMRTSLCPPTISFAFCIVLITTNCYPRTYKAEADRRSDEARRTRQEAEICRTQHLQSARLAEQKQLRLLKLQRENDATDKTRRDQAELQDAYRKELETRQKQGPLTCTDEAVGITIFKRKHPSIPTGLCQGIFIKSVAPGSLADVAGVTCADVIVAVNGRNVARMSCDKAVALLDQFSPPRVLKLRLAAAAELGLMKVQWCVVDAGNKCSEMTQRALSLLGLIDFCYSSIEIVPGKRAR